MSPHRLIHLLRRRRADRELEEELQFHADARARRLEDEGLTPEVARLDARRALGSTLRIRERAADAWAIRWLEVIVQDVRYALRGLRRSPSFTLAAATTLALAVGANTAIFSLVEGILLRPLPYAQPNRLFVIDRGVGMPGAFVTLRRESRAIDYAALEPRELNLTGRGQAQRLNATAVSAELLTMLGLRPRLGRTFSRGEDAPGTARVVILSDWFWQQTFGGDPAAVGRHIVLDERVHEIVGVMPPDIVLPSRETALWLPLTLDPVDVGSYWGRGSLTIVGRLRPAATLDAAQAELRSWLPQIRASFPWRMPDIWGEGTRLLPWRDALVGPVQLTLLVLLGTVVLVWLVACVNVANLLLARAAARSHELAVRAALGAGRSAIVQQLLVESLVLAAIGGGAGIAVAAASLRALTAWLPQDTPRLAEVSMNSSVMAYGVIATTLAAAVFGLVPAWRASGVNAGEALGANDRRSTPDSAQGQASAWLVAGQVALAVILVTSASLLVKSLWRLSTVDTGFIAQGLVTAEVTPDASACPNTTRCVAFYDEVLVGARELGGVADAAAISTLPLRAVIAGVAVAIEDHPREAGVPAFVLWQTAITPQYFRAMRIPVLRGRTFTAADRDGSPLVTIVSAATARRFWPNADPVGRRIRPVSQGPWRTIVGVVGNVTELALSGSPDWVDGAIYVPYSQSAGRGRAPWPMTLVLRGSGAEAAIARDLPASVGRVSAAAAVTRIQTMAGVVSASLAAPRATAGLLTAFASLALVLGAVGIAGVVAYTAAQRGREIGIRIALGGGAIDVLRVTMGRMLMLALTGLMVGLVASLAVTRILRNLLFETGPRDGATFLITAVVVLAVTLAAALIPAGRALRANPVEALRQ